MISLLERGKQLLSTAFYRDANPLPVDFGFKDIDCPKDQYVLRMLVKSPSSGVLVPNSLKWLESLVAECINYQQNLEFENGFIYLTVRCGEVKSETDDLWHVDGFSTRIAHLPEQDYIWSDSFPTEILNQTIDIPIDFDCLKHNIHSYFQDHSIKGNAFALASKHLYLLDPYVIHKRPKLKEVNRKFFRISFVPILIKDDRNTQNPLLPTPRFNTSDIRDRLINYKENT